MDIQRLSEAGVCILLSLAERDRHGYAIMQEVERMTGEPDGLGPGTLYRTLKQLLEAGFIEELEQEEEERRRTYRLTPTGRDRLTAELARLDRLVHVARSLSLLRGGHTG